MSRRAVLLWCSRCGQNRLMRRAVARSANPRVVGFVDRDGLYVCPICGKLVYDKGERRSHGPPFKGK